MVSTLVTHLPELGQLNRGQISKLVGTTKPTIQSIRDRNTKVAALGDKIKQHLPGIDPVHANGGADATLPQKQAAFTDIIVAALASGLTNVVTYTIDDLGTNISSRQSTTASLLVTGLKPSPRTGPNNSWFAPPDWTWIFIGAMEWPKR